MNNNNKVNNRIYVKLVNDIRNNKKLTIEEIDFINALSSDEKMEIILLYDKVLQTNKELLNELLHTSTLK
jgi:hypothetical protein